MCQPSSPLRSRLRTGLLAPFVALATSLLPSAQDTVVFQTDFESGLPPELSAPGAALEGVQGYAGLGTVERRFEGNFLRYSAEPILPTTLVLTGLPPHESVGVGFLLAVIDSWDGAELFQVRVDGQLLFSHWFQLATGDSSSYDAPPGALLSSGSDLGFSGGSFFNRDRAYDLAVDPAFRSIPHTGSTLTVEWTLDAISGGGAQNWQAGADESWAIDELSVVLDPPLPGRIVINADEWTWVTPDGFGRPGAAAYALNVAEFLTACQDGGNLLAYSNDFGLTGSDLAATLTGAGYGWTVTTGLPFTLDTLQNYDAVYLSGFGAFSDGQPDTDVLIDYVQRGGNVYVAGGQNGGAQLWNPFLEPFGLAFGPLNGLSWSDTVEGDHPCTLRSR